MSEQNVIQHTKRKTFSRKTVVSAIIISLGISVICFAVAMILPPSKQPFFKAPVRSILTGLGLLGVAYPLCTVGFLLKKRSANSPYFEEAFIATVINIFGFLCLGLGLLCIGISVYALTKRLLGSP
jgi:hypothetical protein